LGALAPRGLARLALALQRAPQRAPAAALVVEGRAQRLQVGARGLELGLELRHPGERLLARRLGAGGRGPRGRRRPAPAPARAAPGVRRLARARELALLSVLRAHEPVQHAALRRELALELALDGAVAGQVLLDRAQRLAVALEIALERAGDLPGPGQ